MCWRKWAQTCVPLALFHLLGSGSHLVTHLAFLYLPNVAKKQIKPKVSQHSTWYEGKFFFVSLPCQRVCQMTKLNWILRAQWWVNNFCLKVWNDLRPLIMCIYEGYHFQKTKITSRLPFLFSNFENNFKNNRITRIIKS